MKGGGAATKGRPPLARIPTRRPSGVQSRRPGTIPLDTIDYSVLESKITMRVRRRFCETADELLHSDLFRDLLRRCLQDLARRDSPLLAFLGGRHDQPGMLDVLIQTLSFLTKIPLALVPNIVAGAKGFPDHRKCMADFVEHLYNYWRSFERYAVCDSSGDA